MLHLETITPETLALIRELQEDEIMKGFNLVGGTTLALLIGHRMSEDIDLFSESPFDSSKLAEHLKDKYKAENIRTLKNAVFCFIRDVKVDILTHQYPLINPVINEGGIRMVSLEDIGAMKLNVITDSGRRLKDFIDMYSLLEHRSLRDFFDFYEIIICMKG